VSDDVVLDGPWLVVVTGSTGAGKSTMADAVADQLGATVASSDWVMSALRSHEPVWSAVEQPVERQRRVGWDLLARVAEQQLRRRRSCVLDLVARTEPRNEWEALADRYEASFAVIECICSDMSVHRERIEGRSPDIPGWYELTWEQVEASRARYQPLAGPKLVIDALAPVADNLGLAMRYLASQARNRT